MTVSIQAPSHRGQVEAVVEAAEELARHVSRKASELAEDGGQPRFVAALSRFESALQAEVEGLEAVLEGKGRTEQQELTV